MKVFIGDNTHIDFKEPILMTLEQREKFVYFLKNEMFEQSIIFVEKTSDFRKERLGDKFFSEEWSPEEYILLTNLNKSTYDVAQSMGRTWLSINMKRGNEIYSFKLKLKSKNLDYDDFDNLSKDKKLEIIKEWMAEKGISEKTRTIMEEIKKQNNWQHNIKEMKDALGIVYQKLTPKPEEQNFKKAVRELKKTNEYKEFIKANYDY